MIETRLLRFTEAQLQRLANSRLFAGDFLDALLEFRVQVDGDAEHEIRFVELAAYALRKVVSLFHDQS